MSFKKETEKIVLLQVKGLIHVIVKFRTNKNLRISIMSTSHPFERGTTKYCHWAAIKVLCSNKGTN